MTGKAMSEQTDFNLGSLGLEIARQIDAVCRPFDHGRQIDGSSKKLVW
jgi:hypothetical protein